MILTAILNAILALGVIVMVVAPLAFAIVSQRRDEQRVAATEGALGHTRRTTERRTHRRPQREAQREPAVGRA